MGEHFKSFDAHESQMNEHVFYWFYSNVLEFCLKQLKASWMATFLCFCFGFSVRAFLKVNSQRWFLMTFIRFSNFTQKNSSDDVLNENFLTSNFSIDDESFQHQMVKNILKASLQCFQRTFQAFIRLTSSGVFIWIGNIWMFYSRIKTCEIFEKQSNG